MRNHWGRVKCKARTEMPRLTVTITFKLYAIPWAPCLLAQFQRVFSEHGTLSLQKMGWARQQHPSKVTSFLQHISRMRAANERLAHLQPNVGLKLHPAVQWHNHRFDTDKHLQACITVWAANWAHQCGNVLRIKKWIEITFVSWKRSKSRPNDANTQ